MTAYPSETHVIGGVDTHKDLHVAAVVDHRDRVLGTESFPTTRHGYRLMLAWMRSFGDLRRVGVECSGSYGAGLLRYLQAAGVDVLEVTAPDKHDRRRRGKNDDYDAESAAHAAFAADFARVGRRFRVISGTHFTPSWAAISRMRAGWPTVSWSQS